MERQLNKGGGVWVIIDDEQIGSIMKADLVVE